MVAETKRKDDTAKHPYVCLSVYFELHVFINHFRRSIHHCRKLFKLVMHLVYIRICADRILRVQCFCCCWSKITKFKQFVVEQYVFNLDVSVRNAKRMHMRQTLAHIDKNVDNLGLSQLAIVLLQQVKQRAATAQLRQDVHAIRFSVMRHVFEFHNVLVSIHSFPDFYLVLDQGNKAFVLNHYLFKREFFTTHYISCSVHVCESSFPE